ncbi:CLUMA_CG011881, isoform A [Clunio marinus]|uniref:CLUMA_CG011881, isoform A n=1 Tax=Clunio marinus TaxID=568069 RepID=A0A1J1IE90_9DIPT|nr:CLUMA_CG011881, isoform A [Clunio marinus]
MKTLLSSSLKIAKEERRRLKKSPPRSNGGLDIDRMNILQQDLSVNDDLSATRSLPEECVNT